MVCVCLFVCFLRSVRSVSRWCQMQTLTAQCVSRGVVNVAQNAGVDLAHVLVPQPF